MVDMKVFTLSARLKTLSLCELMVDDTVDGKNNKGKKIRGVADIRIYHFSWNFPQKRCDELRPCCLASKFFIFLTCLTTLNIWAMVVNDTVDTKHNMEKKTTRYDRNAPF